VNRRAFLSSLGLGLSIPVVGIAKPEPEVIIESPQSVFLTVEEYQYPMDAINLLMRRYRETNGSGRSSVRIIVFGKRQREDCLNMAWSSSVTREFAVKATEADWYRISHNHFHDEVRAGRGELFGYKLCWVDEDHHCEMI